MEWSARESLNPGRLRADQSYVSIEAGVDERTVRTRLARHPVAVEAASAASASARCRAEVVVFEGGRSYVVATTELEVLQPRPHNLAETALLDRAVSSVVEVGEAAFAVVDAAGSTVGSLTLHGADTEVQLDVLRPLARVVSSVLAGFDVGSPNQTIHSAVLDGLRDAVVVLDADLNITWTNRAVGSLLGRSPADLVGSTAFDLLHPDDVSVAVDALTRLGEGLEIYRTFVRLERGNGSFGRVEVTGIDQSAQPVLAGIVLSLRDAEVADELSASMERVARMSDAIVAGLHDGIIATDQFGAVTMVNAAAREMFGLDAAAPAASLDLADFELLDQDGRPIPNDLHPQMMASEQVLDREVGVVSARGEFRYVTTQQRPVRDGNGGLLGSVVAFHDVTEARRSAEQLRSQALHDQLTGLANRRKLELRLSELADSDPSLDVAACFIDLDNFKLVNDTYGHRVGDQLIRVAANRLSGQLRGGDLLVRQGGDEFVALLVGVDGIGEAILAAERLRTILERPFTLGDDRFDLTASIGLSISSTSTLSIEGLLRNADIALYAAKARGRNRVELFDTDLATAVRLEERQRRVLRSALEDERLVMHFQPLVSAKTGETVGYEALARCRNDDGSFLLPAKFMNSITHSGLMWDLDRAAFNLSCAAAAVLARVDPTDPPVISCNFSAISLAQPGLVEFIIGTIERHHITPSQVCVEITESSAFDAGEPGLAALRTLHANGVLLALDDFGTGYSSLAHLRDLPLSSVKVDRSFVAELAAASSERSIARAVVGLATDLGLGVVAEGVETKQQLDNACQLGFTVIQGWYYSPAMSLTEVLANWLNGRQAG